MTQNQIRFWEMRNTQAHNERMWKETQKHNRETESETKRSNIANEWQNTLNLQEKRRSALENERQQRASLVEQQRHSMRLEMETERSNRAKEQAQTFSNMTNRLNVMNTARYQTGQLSNDRQRIDVERYKAQTQQSNVMETIRSHQASERLQATAQSEITRSNRAQESLSYDRNMNQLLQIHTQEKQNKLGYITAEKDRELRQQQLVEQRRHNEVQEMLGVGSTVAKTTTDLLKLKYLGGFKK